MDLGIEIEERAETVCEAQDEWRLSDSQIDLKNRSKKSRIKKRFAEQQRADAEEVLQISYYSAGDF